MRRPLRVVLARLCAPRWSAEFPLGEPELLGREGHRLEVEYAVMRHGHLKSIRVADDPIDGVSAVARARDREMIGVDEGQLRYCIERSVEIGHHLAAPVL